MSKLSLYNIRVPMSEKSDLLYNSVSDKFIAIRHEVDLRDISVITLSSSREWHDCTLESKRERKGY